MFNLIGIIQIQNSKALEKQHNDSINLQIIEALQKTQSSSCGSKNNTCVSCFVYKSFFLALNYNIVINVLDKMDDQTQLSWFPNFHMQTKCKKQNVFFCFYQAAVDEVYFKKIIMEKSLLK